MDEELRAIGLADGITSESVQLNYRESRLSWMEWAEGIMVDLVGYHAGKKSLRIHPDKAMIIFVDKS